MVTEAKIKEIFSSIQGEGSVVGYKQIFVRFCGCNLNCNYCDTDFSENDSQIYTPLTLKEKIFSDFDVMAAHSISFTGGEPLLWVDFLNEFISLIKNESDIKIYLETNATLTKPLLQIKGNLDIIAADIKLFSATGRDTFSLHKSFLENCGGVQTFAKIVFDENITDDEIDKCVDMVKNSEIELILQPKMNDDKVCVSSEFCESVMDKFLKKYKYVRLIPQTHKFLNIR